jgi:hypothetical protein
MLSGQSIPGGDQTIDLEPDASLFVCPTQEQVNPQAAMPARDNGPHTASA